MRRPDFTPTLLVGFSGKLLGNYIELCASKHLLKSRQKIQVGELPFFGIRLLQCAVRSTGSSAPSRNEARASAEVCWEMAGS